MQAIQILQTQQKEKTQTKINGSPFSFFTNCTKQADPNPFQKLKHIITIAAEVIWLHEYKQHKSKYFLYWFWLTNYFCVYILTETKAARGGWKIKHRKRSALECSLLNLKWLYTLRSPLSEARTTCKFSRSCGFSSPASPTTLTVWHCLLAFVLSGSTNAPRHWVHLRESWSSLYVWTVSSE